MIKKLVKSFVIIVGILVCAIPVGAAEWVDISGTVKNGDGTDLCAMVLANGQHRFTCDPAGVYSMSVPLNDKGQIDLMAFCDSHSPFNETLTPEEAADFDIIIQPAAADSQTVNVTTNLDNAVTNPGWHKISGSVSTQDGTPLCTMVLANGQHMFTCGEDKGSYEMEVPANDDGEIIFYTFCYGFEPYRQTLKTGGDDVKREGIESALKYSLASVASETVKSDDIQQLNNIAYYMDVSSGSGEEFQCGTLSHNDQIIVYIFNGNEECGGLSGTIRQSYSTTGDSYEWNAEYINVTDGTCSINGTAYYNFSIGDNMLTGLYEYDNLSVCGNTYSGSYQMSVDMSTGSITYNLSSETYNYDGLASVETDYTFTLAGGTISLSGSASVVADGETFFCTADNLAVDPNCDLPVSGSFVVQTSDSETAEFDFSNTSCDNRTVTYIYNGVEYTYDLNDIQVSR